MRRAPGQTFAEDEPHRPPYNVPPGRQHNVRVAVRALCCAVPAPASCAFCSAGGSRAAFRAAGTPSSCRHSVVMAADALDLGNLWVRGGLGSRLQYRAGPHTCTRRFPIEVKDFEIPLASAAPTIHMSTVNPCPCFGIAGCPLPVARDRAGSTSPAARYGRDSTRWSRPRATSRPRDSTSSSPPPPPPPSLPFAPPASPWLVGAPFLALAVLKRQVPRDGFHIRHRVSRPASSPGAGSPPGVLLPPEAPHLVSCCEPGFSGASG